MSIFVLENLSKTFKTGEKENQVLKNINLAFPETGLFSIVGKSGCGKSTLLNILMGIEQPTDGKVFFKGEDISKMNDKKFSSYHLQGVSLVFQHYNLFNDLTAYENVEIPALMARKSGKETKEKIESLFDQFGLTDLMKRKVNNLSGGEKQRVAILRSLLTNPDAILCDEPTGALDSKNSREIMGILKEISKNKLVIMVSHNKHLVKEFSDQILILKEGSITENTLPKFDDLKQNKNGKKVNYSSKWTSKFLKLNLKKNLKKNIFSVLSCLVSFTSMFLSVGFSVGSESSQDYALKQNLGIGFATASESEFIEIEGSPLSYEKTTKPDVELVDKYFNEFYSLRYEDNLSYFISNYPTCYFEDKKINNFEMLPLYDQSLQSFGADLLIGGSGISDDFNEIVVNEEFDKAVGGDSLNKVIVISNECSINFQTGDEKLPFVKDTFNLNKKFKIVGIVHEFSFLNSPKIYYSYFGAKNFIKNSVMENVSNFLGFRFTFYDYLMDCKNDDPACSYSSYLFVTDENEVEKFYEKVKTMKDEKLQITCQGLEIKETYATFINSFSSTLIIFVIIAFVGINFILGMISLSTFLEHKKRTAILTCLGARNSSIFGLHLKENYLIIFISFILSIILSYFLGIKLNKIIGNKFGLQNLISIPFKTYLGIPFGLVIMLILIAIICSTIFTLLPMYIYRHNSITNELRDE